MKKELILAPMRVHSIIPATLILLSLFSSGVPADEPLDTIVVTSSRQPQGILEVPQSVTRIDAEHIDALGSKHYSEPINSAPGAYVQRNSGQEGLIAIRSPVLAGAGACGAFLLLEDGFPLRPPGFCNVNELFETNTEQAHAIEVTRGPSSALYGANALHGAIQVIGADPAQLPSLGASLEAGSDQFRRAKIEGRLGNDWGAYVVTTHDGGFRFHSATDEAKGNLRYLHALDSGTLRGNLAFSTLDQQTAGFIQGFDAYQSAALRESNPNPEAFRRAHSARGSLDWQQDLSPTQGIEVRAILRWSQMNFLQHFLLGEPMERNGQRSAGVQLQWHDFSGSWRTTVGLDADVSRSFLIEFQSSPTRGASPAAIAIRPAGYHYNYTVNTFAAGLYARSEWSITDKWLATLTARADMIDYRYDNLMLTGNTDQDGKPCGFGGCLYSRPADRSDHFNVVSPQVSLLYRITPDVSAYVTASRGFRPPESTEAYRLQKQQSIADLRPERLDMLEIGLRRSATRWSYSAAAYTGRKDHYIFRDSSGFNVSNGITRHEGIEFETTWRPIDPLVISAAGTIARHVYDFSRSADQGEKIIDGNQVDTAPSHLYNANATYALGRGVFATLAWTAVGSYYVDAANSGTYPGHQLLDMRIAWQATPAWSAVLRIDNLLDRAYADRADLAFGSYRYLPGRPRTAFFEVRYRAATSERR
jgi:outer membrane receptor protein involved in Fe transport